MRSISFAALTALVALVAAAVPTGATGSQKVPVEVRVVTFEGKILADRSIRTGTTTVRTSSRATCLGGDPPNDRKRIPGATALGALADLGTRVESLNPLLLSGAFDFGIGLCGVGDAVVTGKQWWALKVNGRLAESGGDSTMLKRGDEVLWYLDRSYEDPFPAELDLRVTGGSVRSRLEVKVVSLDGAGKASPAAGAKVFAAGSEVAVTSRSGRATFRVPSRGRKKVPLLARLDGHIPSERLGVGNGS